MPPRTRTVTDVTIAQPPGFTVIEDPDGQLRVQARFDVHWDDGTADQDIETFTPGANAQTTLRDIIDRLTTAKRTRDGLP